VARGERKGDGMRDRISISRWTNSLGKEGVEVSIRNDKYDLIYIGDMTMTEFARCVTGQSMIEIERDARRKLGFSAEQEEPT